jgi:U3 small nucleolar RNA-associated protein 21
VSGQCFVPISWQFSIADPLSGSEAQDPITGLAFDGDFIWASSGPHILKYVRGKEVSVLSGLPGLAVLISGKVGSLTNPLGTSITSPLVFGSLLLTLTEDGRNLLTWDVSEKGEC